MATTRDVHRDILILNISVNYCRIESHSSALRVVVEYETGQPGVVRLVRIISS